MKVKITLRRSLIGQKPKAKETVRSLGLKKINSSNGFAIKLYPNKQTIKVNDNEHYQKISF